MEWAASRASVQALLPALAGSLALIAAALALVAIAGAVTGKGRASGRRTWGPFPARSIRADIRGSWPFVARTFPEMPTDLEKAAVPLPGALTALAVSRANGVSHPAP